ncbi:MAG: hypothetical protein SFU25_10540 [Candidatus Caenarcaniphilales bacterium]|nr:hypothetical protein [Candidatus Caenarcaniphilales bacterium]
MRNTKGAVPPVQIPILLFLYTIMFLISVEFVMLFWLQSSLDTAARQVAFKAATNGQFPVENAVSRCQAAVQGVGQIFPGYSARVRADYVDAVINGSKSSFDNFDEVNEEGGLRAKLVELGAARPNTFWGGSLRGGPGNLLYGGCYGLKDPTTNQITYHAVVHCAGCWPIFLKTMYRANTLSTDVNQQQGKNTFALSAWLEGRGSYSASQSGMQDTSNLNKSLLSSGPRPFIVCTENACDMQSGGDQEEVFPGALSDGTPVCPEFKPQGDSRPAVNQVAMATKQTVFSIDQWPKERQAKCTRCNPCNVSHQPTQTSAEYCKGEDPKPSGVQRLANCGDIDEAPLYFVGLRYACMGVDAFGRIMKTSTDPTSSDYLGRCDHYVMLKPSCNTGVAPMDKIVGDVTNLDGQKGPCIVRRKDPSSSKTVLVCRNDSSVITNFWDGPYSGGPPSAKSEFGQAAIENSLEGKPVPGGVTSSMQVLPQGALDSPLDMAMPYHQLCDICNPGSPMCGKYGTCRNASNLWAGAKTVHQFQFWTNTSFYLLNPIYGQLECKYQRDCMERHCCADAPDIDGYCASRQPVIQQITTRVCKEGVNMWTYKGVPNREPMEHSPYHLPRDGGYPHCSSGAVTLWQNKAGECCAADVATVIQQCGYEKAPVVNLTPPDMSCAACLRDCAGKQKNKFCPSNKPKMNGNCLDEQYPIGGECIGGPGPNPGTWGSPMPANSPPTHSQCNPPPNQPPGIRENCKTNSLTDTNGNTTTTTTCTSCTKCSPTPLVLSFNGKTPQLSNKDSCFPLNQTEINIKYRLIKGSPDYGFLVVDLNKDGIINDGRELFGNWTLDRYNPDGYTALGALKDPDEDGLIKGKELDGLMIWSDLNNDSKSQKNELKSLKQLGIVELDCGRYQVHRKREKMYLDKDKLAFSNKYSEKGFKRKTKNGYEYGYSWDVTFNGKASDECQKQNEKLYKVSIFQEGLYKLNSLIQGLRRKI